MKDFSKIVTLLSFVTLIFIKVSGFHVYSHADNDLDDTIENCHTCELAIEQQQNTFTTPIIFEFEEVLPLADITFNAIEDRFFIKEGTPFDFFSRPPPATI